MVVDSADVTAVEPDSRSGAEHGLVRWIGRCEGERDGKVGEWMYGT